VSLKDRLLERILKYEIAGATASELSDESTISLVRVKQLMEQLSNEGLIAKNGRRRHFGRRGGGSPDVWVGSAFL
jgi:predicted ArsR family transcriptional regulator